MKDIVISIEDMKGIVDTVSECIQHGMSKDVNTHRGSVEALLKMAVSLQKLSFKLDKIVEDNK